MFSCWLPLPSTALLQALVEVLQVKPEAATFNVTHWASKQMGYQLFRDNSTAGTMFLVPPFRRREAAVLGLERVW